MRIEVPDLIIGQRPGAFIVGGCVRDLIQGLTPRDIDIAVPGDPRAFAEETAMRLGGRVFVMGKEQFTVYCVATRKGQIDIMSYKGSDIKEDLLQRDFTVNALACRLSDGHIVDVTGGVEDLQHGVVRMISPRAFRDDPVRLVRAFRMAASLHFSIERETIGAIGSNARLLQHSAAERIWTELQRILACPDSHPYLLLMKDTKILKEILPELVEHRPGAEGANQALGAVRSLEALMNQPEFFLPPELAGFVTSLEEESRVLLKTAMLLRDIGMPLCRTTDAAGRVRHYGYAARGAELAQAIGRRLRMSNRHREWLASMIRRHQRPLFLYRTGRGGRKPSPRAIGRFFRQCGAQVPHLLILSIAGSMAGDNPNAPHPSAWAGFLTEMLTHYVKKIDQQGRAPILNGQDLIQNFNLPPSPVLGTLLRRVEELHLAGLLSNRKQALQWVAVHLPKNKNTPGPKAEGV